jgi:hypothetical protein
MYGILYYEGKKRNSVEVRRSVVIEKNYKECSVRYPSYLRKKDVKDIFLSRSETLKGNFSNKKC